MGKGFLHQERTTTLLQDCHLINPPHTHENEGAIPCMPSKRTQVNEMTSRLGVDALGNSQLLLRLSSYGTPNGPKTVGQIN